MNNLKIGKKILKLRKDNGMSQSDLAEKLDVSIKTVSKWEAGLTLPTIEVLNEISKIFDISIDDLVIEDKKSKHNSKTKTLSNKHFDLILIGSSLACGIALLVTSIFKSVDVYSGFAMIGLGLTSISLYLLRKK